MKKVIHKAETRGHADHGWLHAHHTFSFADYHNPDRMNFGVLRVLNDDRVTEGRGFGSHPHKNMEIISIPLQGNLKHMDSMGNVTVIKEGDVQVMSAGTGVFHSEYNESPKHLVEFLQIWIIPNKRNVEPRYDQISLKDIEQRNTFFQILSSNKDDQGVWIHQDAWFYLGNFDTEITQNFTLNNTVNGLYVFVLEGSIEVAGEKLNKRDGAGFWNVEELTFNNSAKSSILLMEVPMQS